MSSSESNFTFYHYTPSSVAAVIFAALFLISSLLHSYQLIRTRLWYFIPLVLGGFCESIGYIGRVLSSREAPDYTLGPYIIQSLLLLIAPVLFAASIYMELGHIVLLVDGETHSPIKRKFLTAIFVLGDIFAFMVQSTGASVLTKKKPNSAKTGQWIIIGGLVIQIVFFGFFMIVSIIFHRRVLQTPTRRSNVPDIPWRKHLWALYATSLLILVRSVFRAVEYVMGNDGYLMRNEVWLYVFDSVLMFLVVAIFNVIHPSEVKGLLKGYKASRWVIRMQTMKQVTDLEDSKDAGTQKVEGYMGPNAAYAV